MGAGEETPFEMSADLLDAAEAIIESDDELRNLAENVSIEAAGSRLSLRAEPNVRNLSGASPIWAQLKREVFLLLCTKDRKYQDLRRRLRAADSVTRHSIIPTVASAIAVTIHVGAGLITPFLALALLGAAQLGVSAWCATSAESEPSFGSDRRLPKRQPRSGKS
jgi:hypothetical protein